MAGLFPTKPHVTGTTFIRRVDTPLAAARSSESGLPASTPAAMPCRMRLITGLPHVLFLRQHEAFEGVEFAANILRQPAADETRSPFLVQVRGR